MLPEHLFEKCFGEVTLAIVINDTTEVDVDILATFVFYVEEITTSLGHTTVKPASVHYRAQKFFFFFLIFRENLQNGVFLLPARSFIAERRFTFSVAYYAGAIAVKTIKFRFFFSSFTFSVIG